MSVGRGWSKRIELRPEAPKPHCSDAIDLAHLRRYTLDDRALEREVLDLFLAQLPVNIAGLRAAASDKDWKVAAHTVKGSARAVGAWPLADAAAAAERVDAGSDRAVFDACIVRVEAAAAAVRLAIAAGRAGD